MTTEHSVRRQRRDSVSLALSVLEWRPTDNLPDWSLLVRECHGTMADRQFHETVRQGT